MIKNFLPALLHNMLPRTLLLLLVLAAMIVAVTTCRYYAFGNAQLLLAFSKPQPSPYSVKNDAESPMISLAFNTATLQPLSTIERLFGGSNVVRLQVHPTPKQTVTDIYQQLLQDMPKDLNVQKGQTISMTAQNNTAVSYVISRTDAGVVIFRCPKTILYKVCQGVFAPALALPSLGLTTPLVVTYQVRAGNIENWQTIQQQIQKLLQKLR